MDSPFSARFRLADRGDIPAAGVSRGIAQQPAGIADGHDTGAASDHIAPFGERLRLWVVGSAAWHDAVAAGRRAQRALADITGGILRPFHADPHREDHP